MHRVRKDCGILSNLPDISLALLLISITVAVLGCGDENATGISSQYSIVRGIVTDDSGSYSSHRNPGPGSMANVASVVQGATVVAMSASLGPSLEAISDTTHTDAAGNFSLTCEATNIRNVIVVATKGTKVWEAVVGSNLNSGGTEYCQPLTEQSTVEAQVYVMLSRSAGSGAVTYADVVEIVSSPVASAAENSATGIEKLAASIAAGEQAWTAALWNSSVGNVPLGSTNVVEIARTTAEESLELSLNTAGENQVLADHAFVNYLQADQNAYVIEGVSRQAVAQIAAICARAETDAMMGADSGLVFAVTRQTDLVTAVMVKGAVDSSMQVLLASQSRLDSADAAGEALIEQIQSGSTLAGLDSSLKTYHNTIVQLTAEEVGEPAASGVILADSKINGVGGLRSTLLSTAALQLSSTDLVQVYAGFFQGVESLVHSDIGSLPGLQINSIAGILMLTNMMGGSKSTP